MSHKTTRSSHLGLCLFLFRCVVPVLLFLPATTLWAQRASERDGFLFNFLLGGGTENISFTDAPPAEGGMSASSEDYEASASSFFFASHVGRAATENFFVHINAFYNFNPERELKPNKNSVLASLPAGTKINQRSRTFGFGMGFTYYYSPWNVYISPEYRSAVYTRIEHRLEIPNDLASSYAYQRGKLDGVGFGLSLGKEFWLSSDTSMGLAFVYQSDSLSGRSFEERPRAVPGGGNNAAYEKFSPQRLSQVSYKRNFLGFALSLSYN